MIRIVTEEKLFLTPHILLPLQKCGAYITHNAVQCLGDITAGNQCFNVENYL